MAGLSLVFAAGPCQRSLSRVRVPWDSRPYFTFWFEASLFAASYDSQGHGGGIWPRYHTGQNWLFIITLGHTTQKTPVPTTPLLLQQSQGGYQSLCSNECSPSDAILCSHCLNVAMYVSSYWRIPAFSHHVRVLYLLNSNDKRAIFFYLFLANLQSTS
jgi:hypothetical protein